MKAKLILIGLLSAVVLSGLWYFFLWKPAGDDLDQAKSDRAAAETEAQQLQVRLAHLRNLEKNADILERDRALFATAMPAGDELDAFIHQVNERASRAGVGFVSIAPAQPSAEEAGTTDGAAPVSIGLTMSIQGDYFQLLRFLEEMRDGPRVMTIESFALSRVSSGPMTASVGGRMFMNPSATAAPVAPTASA